MGISKIGQEGLDPSRILLPSQLPAGSVLQVVNTISSTPFVTSSTSYLDIGLSLSITPTSTSSKILIIATLHTDVSGPTGYGIKFVRNSTAVFTTWNAMTYRNAPSFRDNSPFIYCDSPATTSAITYKVQAGAYDGGYNVTFNETYGAGTFSTLTLMEIAG